MKIKVQDASGIMLDWLVCNFDTSKKDMKLFWSGYCDFGMYHYSSEWEQGGPIIEREGIQILCNLTADDAARFKDAQPSWIACDKRKSHIQFYGTTPLIAAMRCYVAGKLGDEVDVPDEFNPTP